MVKVNVPGVGEITAENAASEDTLSKLLSAVRETNRLQQLRATGKTTEQRNNAAALDQHTKSVTGNTKTRDAYNRKLKEALDSQEEYTEVVEESMDLLELSMRSATSTVTSTLGDLALSAVSLTSQFLTGYDDMAKNPIGAAAGTMATAIDMAAIAAKKTADVITGAATAATGWIPFADDSLKAALETGNKVAQAAVDTAQLTLGLVNTVFAKELEKSSAALAEFTSLGASFAGGLTQMRNTAVEASLPIDRFSKSVSLSSDNLRMSGLSQGEGARQLAKVMGQTARITNEAGFTLRDQMMGMGISYEEQGELIAQIMATERVANSQKRMTDREIAEATRDYAADLKVLRDITGEDAKKAMDLARAKALEADIISQLSGSPAEIEKFQKALAATPEPLRKGFLEFVASGGKVITDQATNIMMAQIPELRSQYENMFSGIKDPSVAVNTMVDSTLTGFQEVGVQARELGGTMAAAVRLGGLTGAVADAVSIQNDLIRIGLVSPEEVAKSREAVTAQASLADQQSANLTQLAAITNNHAMEMEKLINQNMGAYTEYTKDILAITTDAIQTGISFLGKSLTEIAKEAMSLSSEKTPEVEAKREKYQNDMAQIQSQISDAKAELEKTGYGLWNKITGSMTDEMKAAQAALEALENKRVAIRDEARTENMSRVRAAAQAQMQGATSDTPVAPGKGKAAGGISSGPKSGYFELLHGTEAVVPLPDGKSIPVKMDLIGDITKQLSAPNADLESRIAGQMRNIGYDNKLLAGKLDLIQFNLKGLAAVPAFGTPGAATPDMEFSKAELASTMLATSKSMVSELMDDLRASLSNMNQPVTTEVLDTQRTLLSLLSQFTENQSSMAEFDLAAPLSEAITAVGNIVNPNMAELISTAKLDSAKNADIMAEKMTSRMSAVLENTLKTQTNSFRSDLGPVQSDITAQIAGMSGASKESNQELISAIRTLTDQNSEMIQLMSDSVSQQRRIVDNTN